MSLRGAIIGFGHIVVNGHVPAFQENKDFEIVAIFDVMKDREEEAKKIFPHATFYSSIDELFTKENFDFVDIATPPSSHIGYIERALNHNKHVLCEKPLILSEEDFHKIIKWQKKSHRTIFTVHNWKYAPILEKTKALIEEGCIGQVKKVRYEVIRYKPSVAVSADGTNWRLDPKVSGGGILVDHGWHAFYIIHSWLQGYPTSVICQLENRKYKDISVEDTANITIKYENATAEVFFTWAGKERKNYIAVTGTEGSIEVLDGTIQVTGKDSKEIQFPEALSQGSHHPDWYGKILDEFFMEIKNGVHDNFANAKLCLDILLSGKKSHDNMAEHKMELGVQE